MNHYNLNLESWVLVENPGCWSRILSVGRSGGFFPPIWKICASQIEGPPPSAVFFCLESSDISCFRRILKTSPLARENPGCPKPMKEPSLLIPIDCLLPSVGTFIATRYKKNQKPTEKLSKTILGAPLNLRFFASDASSGGCLFELSRRHSLPTHPRRGVSAGARPQNGGNLPRCKVWSPTKNPNSEGAGL